MGPGRMRIAVVTTSYPEHDGDPSGHFVEAEVGLLAAAGHAVRVVRPTPGGAFGWPGVPARLRAEPWRIGEVATWALKASRELRTHRPERVVAHWAIPAAFPIVFGARVSCPLEIVSHGGDVRLLRQLPARARASLVRRLSARATTWRFVSEELRESLVETLPPAERARLLQISTIKAGALEVPDVSVDAASKRRSIGGRRLYVCAGRLVPSKRIDKVIDHVASNERARGDRVLVVLGDGPERANLERMAKAWQMDVRFIGKVSRRETLSWIGAADELVHASRAEGLSTVVREADLLGTPVTVLS